MDSPIHEDMVYFKTSFAGVGWPWSPVLCNGDSRSVSGAQIMIDDMYIADKFLFVWGNVCCNGCTMGKCYTLGHACIVHGSEDSMGSVAFRHLFRPLGSSMSDPRAPLLGFRSLRYPRGSEHWE